MAGTTVIYAGVQLHNCKTTQWDQEIVYDESRTDALFVRFKLKFQCLLHAQGVSGQGNGPYLTDTTPIWTGGLNSEQLGPGDSCRSLRELTRRLKTPRSDLKITMGNNVMLAVAPYSSTNQVPSAGSDQGRGYDAESVWTDVENGPKPQGVHVTQVTSGAVAGAAVFQLDFEIHVSCVCCNQGNINFVLNNRWSIAESMDANFFTTRSISGKLRVASALLNHEMARVIILPTLENGFRRESIDYTVSPDGLEVTYVVRDRQVYQSAPWPCTRMEGTHRESTADGLTWHSAVSVEVEGHPGASKNAMLAWIVKVMENRLGNLSTLNSANGKDKKVLRWVESCVFTDHIGERNVMSGELVISHMLESGIDTSDGQYLNDLNSQIGTFGQPLELKELDSSHTYKSTESQEPATWGYNAQGGDAARNATGPASARLLLACYLQSPCYDAHNIGNANSPSYYAGSKPPSDSESKPTSVTSHPTKVTLPATPDPTTNLSTAQGEAAYSVARMESHYHRDPVRAQLPIAASGLKPADDTCSIVTLGGDQAQAEFHYEAERFGKQPQIPPPKDAWKLPTGLKATLLRHYTRHHPPTVSANSTGKFFRTEAYYLYALNRPPLPAETIPVGVLPALSYQSADNRIVLQDIYDNAQAFDTVATAK